jgi:hypothetical protein
MLNEISTTYIYTLQPSYLKNHNLSCIFCVASTFCDDGLMSLIFKQTGSSTTVHTFYRPFSSLCPFSLARNDYKDRQCFDTQQ